MESKHLFWNSKPMATTKKQSDSPVLIQEEHGFTIPKLSPSLEWDTFNRFDTEKINEAHTFIEKHYYSKGYQYQIVYSKNHILFELGTGNHLIVSIRSKKTNHIVALIMGSVRHIIYKTTSWEQVLFINFLCVQQELRHLRLAPLLITEISRQAHEQWGVQRAYYISITELPVPFSKTTYAHRILNILKCIECDYWKPSKKEIQKWSRVFSPEKRNYTFEWIKSISPNHSHMNYQQYTDWINAYNQRHKHLYEVMTSERVKDICTSDCFEKCIVYQRSTQTPIGFMCAFYHPYRVVDNDQLSHLMTVVLYSYGICESEEDNRERIFTECLEEAREHRHWDLFTTTDTTITDSNYIFGHSYYHYMYNVCMPEMDARKIALMGL
jgi:hypothetical protein